VTKTSEAPQIPLDGLANLSFNTASNRINSAGFEYDPAGNQTRAVINDGGTQQQYRYDCAGRLALVLDANGNVLATHAYGASNQRLMSVEGGGAEVFRLRGRTDNRRIRGVGGERVGLEDELCLSGQAIAGDDQRGRWD
jgi:YD repeat-containing protein